MLPQSVTPPPEHAEALGVAGTLAVSRIWPRGQGRLSLELLSATGAPLAGQWFAEGDDRERIALATRARALRPEHVLLLPSRDGRGRDAGTVLVQAHGADRRLRALPRLLTEPGTTLLVHRPERRAVVHRHPSSERARADRPDSDSDSAGVGADGAYVRVLRPGRTEPAVRAAEVPSRLLSGLPAFDAPTVCSHRADDGVVVTSAVPGRSVRDLGVTGAAASLAGAGEIGRLLRHLGRVAQPEGLPHRDADAELRWVGTWLARVGEHLPQVHGRLAPALTVVAGHLQRTTPTAPGVVHGDLHDGQVLVTDDGVLGVLDWDTVAVGEGALDAANVWAHTDLRRLLGQWPGEHAEAVWDAVVEGWEPSAAEFERADAYRRLILLRLACQYAFRPAHDRVLDELAELAEAGPGRRRRW